MLRTISRGRTTLQILAVLSLLCFALPAGAQQPTKVDPQSAAVKERQLLGQAATIQGRGTIPDTRSYVLEQPEGRSWSGFHSTTLPWIGAITILGALIASAAFYVWRGTIRVKSGLSGLKVVRFSAFERFVHWMTASSFVVLAISGLNISFGRSLVLPWLGADAFSAVSQWLKYAHNYLSVPFVIGIVLMVLMWTLGNIPNRTDADWIRRGGGILNDDHPPAYRFNSGQKVIFWIVVLGGVAVFITGSMLIFPFYRTTLGDLQDAQRIHAIVAMLFIAAIIGHAYIGTLGMEGAFEAMGHGTVDRNWALQHHILWLQQQDQKRGVPAHKPHGTAEPRLAQRPH